MNAIIHYRCVDRCQASHRHIREWTAATADEVPTDSGAEYEWMTASDSTAAPSPREPKPTKCTGLVSWLLEQIAEDESAAFGTGANGYQIQALANGIATTVGGAYLRAECQAKRAIIDYWRTANEVLEDMHAADNTYWEDVQGPSSEVAALDAVLKLLAVPYADRPGYREEWRPGCDDEVA